MTFELQSVAPWGRSLSEYRRMFALSEADLGERILGCADGPASFNAELTAAGGDGVSADPIYCFSADQIRSRIQETSTNIIDQATRNQDLFVWSEFPDPVALLRCRLATMERFLDDYEVGRGQGRYVDAALPELPFADDAFGIAVCSHFLFLYSDHLTATFHLNAIQELCRVARDVRVFPLVDLNARRAGHLDFVSESLVDEGYTVQIETVDYEFQRGANQMLRIAR